MWPNSDVILMNPSSNIIRYRTGESTFDFGKILHGYLHRCSHYQFSRRISICHIIKPKRFAAFTYASCLHVSTFGTRNMRERERFYFFRSSSSFSRMISFNQRKTPWLNRSKYLSFEQQWSDRLKIIHECTRGSNHHDVKSRRFWTVDRFNVGKVNPSFWREFDMRRLALVLCQSSFVFSPIIHCVDVWIDCWLSRKLSRVVKTVYPGSIRQLYLYYTRILLIERICCSVSPIRLTFFPRSGWLMSRRICLDVSLKWLLKRNYWQS